MIQRPLTTIRCKECSHALSSRAKKCPLCGCPVEKSVEKNVLPLRWLLVIPAVLIIIFMVLGRPNNGASDGTQEASSQQGRSQGEGRTHEPTSRGRSESAAGNHELAPQRQAKNKEVLPGAAPGAPAQYEAGSTEVEAVEAFGLGRTHLEKGDYNLAIQEFTEAVRRIRIMPRPSPIAASLTYTRRTTTAPSRISVKRFDCSRLPICSPIAVSPISTGATTTKQFRITVRQSVLARTTQSFSMIAASPIPARATTIAQFRTTIKLSG